MPGLSRCRWLTKGKLKRDEIKPHKADAGGWEEAIELEGFDCVKVATTLDCYETPPTVRNDIKPEIVANFVHPWMMKAVLASLAGAGLSSTTRIQGDEDQDLRTLAATWPRDEPDQSVIVRPQYLVRRFKRQSSSQTKIPVVGKLRRRSHYCPVEMIRRLFSIKRERS